MATPGYRLAMQRLPLIRQQITHSPSVSQIQSHFSFMMPKGTSLARMSDRQYVSDSNRIFSVSKAIAGFDNSKHTNRYSGCDYSGAQSGMYLATRGKNGIFPSITSESAHYTDKQKYFDLLEKKMRNGTLSLTELRQYMEPSEIFGPNKVVIAFESQERYVWSCSDVTSCHELELVLRPQLLDLKDILAQVYKDAPDHEKRKILTPLAEREIRASSSSPLSMECALTLGDYSVSSAIGNTALGQNLGVLFRSARADVLSSPEYMEGGSNLVIPMFGGQPVDLQPKRIYTFEPSKRAVVSADVFDSQGNPNPIQL